MNEPVAQNLQIIEAGQPYDMDGFRHQDAPGIVNLFRSVYGEGYPVRLYYDEKALTEANAKGTCYSLVARTPTGDIVGVENVFRSAPSEHVYETGSGLVLKEYRNQGITRKLLGFLADEWGPRQENIHEIFGEPVCNHTHMQKLVQRLDFAETALEVALMPAEAYDRERSAKGRVAALLAFRPYRHQPHVVYLPPLYEKELRLIYSWLNYPRDFVRADQELPDSVGTQADMTIFDFARVARITMHQAGTDLPRFLADLEREAREKKVIVFQVWLKLTDPWVGSAVESLSHKGYFFGGVLPYWFDQDGLFMQKVLCEPQFEEIRLYSDHGRAIRAMVWDDWKRVQEQEAPSLSS